jgi:hypothetical protein
MALNVYLFGGVLSGRATYIFPGTDSRSFSNGNLLSTFIFGMPDPRPQMLQKKLQALMIAVIIISDLYHSNPTGFNGSGEGSALVVVSAYLSAFHSSIAK